MGRKQRLEEAQFAALVDSVDTSGIDGLIDPEDIPGADRMEAMPEPWTKRGEMIRADKLVIQRLADTSPAASRIFVTGEAEEAYIGEDAVRLLLDVNDVYYREGAGHEPLFVNTRNGTVRMTRFDPAKVWHCLHPDTLVRLVQDEIDRVGVDMDPWKMNYLDFYQNMTAAMKATYGEDIILMQARSNEDDFYHGVYLACLLLFGKPGYMDVPVAEHFARKEAAGFLRRAVFLQLKEGEKETLEELRKEYGSIRSLTNPEMHFVVDLYERVITR